MKIAVSTHLFLYHDIIGKNIIEVISGEGFHGVELWGMKPHFPYNDTAKVEHIGSLGEKNGVEFLTVHLPMYERVHESKDLRGSFSPASEDPSSRARWKSNCGASARAAAGLGAKYMTVHTDIDSPEAQARASIARQSFAVFIEDELPKGTVLSLENDLGGVERIKVLLEIMEGLDENRIGITLDLGHALVGEDDIADCIKACGSRLKVVHAHDNDGSSDEHLPPGRGCMPWERVIETLRETGFTGPFVWEIRDPTAGKDPGFTRLKEILREIKRFDKIQS